jgi:hypothetical protein
MAGPAWSGAPRAPDGVAGWRYRALGVELRSTFPLPGMRPLAGATGPAVSVELASLTDVERAWSGRGPGRTWESTFSDGCHVRVDPGVAGDHRLMYGEHAAFHLSSDAQTLLCSPARFADPGWSRFLLDTALWSVSIIRGFEALHASAVEIHGAVVAFLAPTGGGKTSLAAELVRRGNPLFCDDVLALGTTKGGLRAHPGPPLMNLPLGRLRAGAWIDATLATFEDEAWVAVANAVQEPRAVAALYLLDRRGGVDEGVRRVAPSPLRLLPHSIGFRHLTGRERARFEVLADLAAMAPIYTLTADPRATPAILADLVERSIAEPMLESAALVSGGPG